MLFNFDIEDADEDVLVLATSQLDIANDQTAPAAPEPAIPHQEVSLSSLLATLPPLISYTPVTINLTNNATSTSTSLLRRDLFDARFQVLTQDEDAAEGEADADGAPVEPSATAQGKRKEEFVDEGTDLIKGVYEGGLKTWECSLDLVDCLDGLGYGLEVAPHQGDVLRGKSILELGCGTALPTCSLFARLLAEIEASPADPAVEPPLTRIHLQDYNTQVLSLITLPNLLLTYGHHLASHGKPAPAPFTADGDAGETLPSPDSLAGEVDIAPEFLASFEDLLARERIELRFFSGAWAGFAVPAQERYELVLTSETVYELGSVPSLIGLLEAASWPGGTEGRRTECLVACKRIYFGVGGGELEFRRRCEERGAEVGTAWGDKEGQGQKGVGRVVMSVQWK